MDIRFISSLTAEDEDLFAPAVLKAVSALLDQLPIAYTMRIETAGAQVYQYVRMKPGSLSPESGARATLAASSATIEIPGAES
jgi:hypothetical protein